MKLKTLKDLDVPTSEFLCVPSESVKALRKEAIKWIKELKKTIVYPYGKDIPILDGDHKLAKYVNSEKWIKHFFNLEEEDLK